MPDKPKGEYGTHEEAGYADPGYQKDGKPRYPLKENGQWDETRIESAWRYIHQEKDRTEYSPEDWRKIVKHIESVMKERGMHFTPSKEMQAHKTGEQVTEVERMVLASKELNGVPEWIQLCPPGRIAPTGHPPFINDAAARALILKDFSKRKNDMLIDYEHQNRSGGIAPAAGWIKEMQDRGDGPEGGIWGRVEWTDRAAQYLKNREYRYFSPVVFRRLSDDRLVKIDHGALTNDPAIDGMVPIVNKAGKPEPYGSQKKEDVMPKWLKDLLGMPETATEEEVQTACRKRIADGDTAVEALKTPEVPGEIVEALGLDKGASVSVCKGTIEGLKKHSETSALAAEVASLKAENAKRKAEDAVMQALKDGKVTPANTVWAREYAEKDLDGFLAFCKAAPKVIETGEVAKGKIPGEGGGALTEIEIAGCKNMGIDPKEFAEYKAKTKGEA